VKLKVNDIIKWTGDPSVPGSSRIERIIAVDKTGTHFYAINADKKKRKKKERTKPVPRRQKKIAHYERTDLEAAYDSAQVCVLEVDHLAPPLLTADDLKDPKYRNVKLTRDQRYEAIKPLVTGENAFKVIVNEHERARLVEKQAKEKFKHGKNGEEVTYSRQSIYTFLYLWWRRGQTIDALFGDYLNCGARGKERVQREKKLGRPSRITQMKGQLTGVVLSKRWLTIIALGVTLFLERRKIKDIPTAYRRTLELFCPKRTWTDEEGKVHIEIPHYTKGEVFSPRQFEYRAVKGVNRCLRRFIEKKVGKREYNLRYRGQKFNSTRQASYPGALYQIDGTIADVYLVSRLNGKYIIGRPVIIVIIDVFSRMIVGFSVRMEKEGWLGIRLALKNSTEDKVAFCAKYGITISEAEWPNAELCDEITGDRGPMIGYNADNLAEALGVSVSNLPPYRADWKGIVEQFFRLLNIRIIKHLPGALQHEPRRGDSDVRLDGVLNLDQFIAHVIDAIYYHNNQHYMPNYPLTKQMIADNVRPIPCEIYRWGVEKLAGKPRTKNSQAVLTHLLPSGDAKVTGQGIRFKKQFYTCETAEKEGWKEKAIKYGARDVKVSYDPRVPEVIYLRSSEGSVPEPCYLTDPDAIVRGTDWVEIEDYYEKKSVTDEEARPLVMQARNDLDRKADERNNTAKMNVNQARVNSPDESSRSLLKKIKEKRQEEINAMNEEDRREILEQAGLLDADGDNHSGDNSDDEYVPRAGFSNVLSIQESRMEQYNEQET
jgi:putative transposase